MKLTESQLRKLINEVLIENELGAPESFLDDAWQELLKIKVSLSKLAGVATKNNATKLAEDISRVRDQLNDIMNTM